MSGRDALPLTDMACCAPLTREPLSAAAAGALALTLKAIADPTRLRLLSMVAAHEGGEACVCDLTEPLGLTQPTVSHHLKVLVDAGLLTRDKRGVWAYFALVPGALDSLAAVLAGERPGLISAAGREWHGEPTIGGAVPARPPYPPSGDLHDFHPEARFRGDRAGEPLSTLSAMPLSPVRTVRSD